MDSIQEAFRVFGASADQMAIRITEMSKRLKELQEKTQEVAIERAITSILESAKRVA